MRAPALLLPALLLYGGFFSDIFFFVLSLFIIFCWENCFRRVVPPSGPETGGREFTIYIGKSLLVLAVLVLGAVILDAYMASRFDTDDALEDDGRTPSAVHRKAR